MHENYQNKDWKKKFVKKDNSDETNIKVILGTCLGLKTLACCSFWPIKFCKLTFF